MAVATEYLVIIDQGKVDALYRLCVSIEDFERLLGSGGTLQLQEGSIRTASGSQFLYKVDLREVQHKKQRCFHLVVRCDDEETQLEEYLGVRRSIREIVFRSGGTLETLWDDVSLYYSERSYPVIHRVENLLRKLIAYFMLTNIGKDWVEEASPGKFKDAVDKSKRKKAQHYVDVLHQVDFIHLADFLFKPYSPKTSSELLKVMVSATSSSDLDIEMIRCDYMPRSNWERYFFDVVKCEDEYLRKRWERLYELRCQVAHNALVTAQDYGEIIRVAGELETHIQQAIDGLGDVQISDADREQIAESVTAVRGELYRGFIAEWRELEQSILIWRSELPDTAAEGHQALSVELVREYEKYGILDSSTAKDLTEALSFRNRVVHGLASEAEDSEISEMMELVRSISKSLKRDWRDEVAGALRALGGEATLSEIYDYIDENSMREKTDNWKAIVRYTINRNSSDTETFKYGGVDMFRHVERGRWALRSGDNT